jgi:NAD(P)-dependent dehydrogenase (short-subunit alcohol dehydrogenase family)
MQISGKVAVVTGGASGIGRALCVALAEQGAAGVVVADIDGGGASEVAEAIRHGGGRAIAVAADMASEAEVQALVTRAEDEFGRVDVFCSNAGIIVGGGVEVSDAAWSRIWAINVQSHVYVARAVLPGMLARGEGYLVFTASAAGLLTQLGSAPYAVTKHALVALAEWISISYGDRGIAVSCLCPQAVGTNLGATSAREMTALDPAGAGPGEVSAAELTAAAGAVPSPAGSGSVSRQASVDGVLTAEQVAGTVIEALADERFLILPHPEVATYEQRRAGDRDRWLSGMRRMASRLTGAS